MPLTIRFLRHGQTALSRANAFCGSGLDPELTPEGLEMAKAFAAAASKRKWSAIYASPLRRTRETAQPLADAIGAKPELRDGLKEIAYGKWEGKSVEEVTRDFHDDYLRWSTDPAWNAPTGGETAVEIAARVMAVVAEVRERHVEGDVLLVSHKATIRVALCALLGVDLGRFRERFDCPVASLTTVEFVRTGPLLRALGDRSHLDERLRTLPGT